MAALLANTNHDLESLPYLNTFPSHSVNFRYCRPADNFISACLSCHSVAQKIPEEDVCKDELDVLVPPNPVQDRKGQWIPEDDKITMKWCDPLYPLHISVLLGF